MTECLNVLMMEARENGLFEGLKVGKDKVEISHLQYADDVIFMGKWCPSNIINITKILKWFPNILD